jgi:hypothetical protein
MEKDLSYETYEEKIFKTLEWLTRRWWFYLLLFIIPFFIPFYTATGHAPQEVGNVINEVLIHALIPFRPFMPALKIIVALSIIALFIYGNRIGKIFTLFMGVNFFTIAFVQSIAVTEKFGLAIITPNLIWFSIVGLFWLWEAKLGKTDFTFYKQPLWKYWVIPLAILAFWAPLTPWNFNPIYLLTSDSPLAFCLMAPIYLAIFSFVYPKVNFPALRVTSFIGSCIGIFNMAGVFIGWGLYHGFIHIPLLAISLYCFVISIRR